MIIVKKQIKALKFGLLSPEKIKKISCAKIITPELYDMDGYPVDGGLMDLRLGAIDPGVKCRTCGGRLKECLGHPGSIEFARPVVHVKYVPIVYTFLRSFCNNCGRILLDEENIKKLSPAQRMKKSKDAKKCHYCQTVQEKIKIEKPTSFMLGKKRIFPPEIRAILEKITDDDCRLIGVNPETFRPEWGILTVLLVPPVTVRPSITLESGERSEDDLTHKLGDIIRSNQRLWENLNAGAPEVIIDDLWDLLQYHVTTFFDNTISRIPPARHRSGQPLKTITERIKGKEGRIRHNLAGKRVNFSSRTVISPDPSLQINEVGVPYEIAEVLTVNEEVTTLNIDYLKKLIMSEHYPGANYIIRPDGRRKKISPELKKEIIEELKPGYFVERHLQDGDIVLFNRHPSLHRGSLMAHYVKVLPYRTFRLHPAVVFPYNADFDGDEMNVHVPQTEEARAEARILLDVSKNLMSPKNNTSLIGTITDAVTGNYLLGLSNVNKAEAQQLLFNAGMIIKQDKKTFNGKDIFLEILPPISKSLSQEIEKKDLTHEYTFGVENEKITKEVDKELGRKETIDAIKKAFTLGTNYLSRRGFTISLEDINVNEKTKKITYDIIKDGEEKTKEIIDAYNNETLEIIPGKTLDESREIKILQTLNEIRTKIGKAVKTEFPEDNPVNHMIMSGAGGNILNITQIACSVGQKSLWSQRINFGYNERTLSSFKQHDLSPKAHGFVYSSYMNGLEPQEFFFDAISGRDGLMDTALRTPKSGYLYRRLANALQDLRVEYDGTVRDAVGQIIQFKYGDDGIDVAGAHFDNEVSPGEAIGIVTAQSFGEPSTQMVLNVFHFAGVQEMQVTLGLPRLIEIFDARKMPSTPAMEIHLDKDFNDEKDAKVLAEKIKEAKLKEILSEAKINFSDKKIEFIIDNKAIRHTHMSINTVAEKIAIKGYKISVKNDSIILSIPDLGFKEIYKLKEKLKESIISGVKGIKQVLIVKRERGYVILTAGSNLAEIIKVKGVAPERTITNDIYEMANVFGIESARQVIMNEIRKVLGSQGLDIDERHLKLVADAMTIDGEIRGMTRMGIIARKSSILAKASFETPIKHFVNATIKGGKDELLSVIENIILNQPVPVGTGLPGLMVKITGPLVREKDRKTLKKEK
ncbi:DNA-directed RNA polymerase subunit A' [Candidatus Pacearchaeota archaeon]|nr:DNA-directed RNA polymerase subunit A' [Candidatus Pacearchaeota archaeon]MBI4156874.1 DNA-directed RNA polymerase subunit A' [Candidatus Woesearchaeota archaeon]